MKIVQMAISRTVLLKGLANSWDENCPEVSKIRYFPPTNGATEAMELEVDLVKRIGTLKFREQLPEGFNPNNAFDFDAVADKISVMETMAWMDPHRSSTNWSSTQAI